MMVLAFAFTAFTGFFGGGTPADQPVQETRMVATTPIVQVAGSGGVLG